jgi:hypothetical protein
LNYEVHGKLDFNNFFINFFKISLLASFFQEIQITQFQGRYKDNPSIHPELNLDLWLETGSSGGPDRNQVYKDLWTGHSVSIIGCSLQVLSTQFPKF